MEISGAQHLLETGNRFHIGEFEQSQHIARVLVKNMDKRPGGDPKVAGQRD